MRNVSKIFGFALGLVLLQVAILIILAPKVQDQGFAAADTPPGWVERAQLLPPHSPVRTGYLRLLNWDALHYFDIAHNGFVTTAHPPTKRDAERYTSNAAFFPGFPIAARLISRALDLPLEVGILVSSQFFALVFWIYLLLLLRSWKLQDATIGMATLSIAVHPATFFMVCGYTESLFGASILGYLFWTGRNSLLALPHGFAMSATRLVGLIPSSYPLFRRIHPTALALAGLSTLGAFSFFWFCQTHLGRWDMYFLLNRLGWDNNPNYFALLDPRTYIPHFFFEETTESISRAAIPFSFALLFASLKWDPRPKERLGLYFVAFSILYVCISGKANSNMLSMIRITFPAFVVLVLCLSQVYSVSERAQIFWKKMTHGKWAYLTYSLYLLSFSTQIWMAFRFLRGRWAA